MFARNRHQYSITLQPSDIDTVQTSEDEVGKLIKP